jgi:predicted dehydrogenase
MLGVVGCGNISPLYLRAAKHFPALTFVACSDLDMGAARARAAEFGLKALSVAELLARDDIRVIVNLTVPQAHAAVARAALGAGKHVYNEKPLATSVADAQALLALADARGLRVACAPSTFLGAAVQTCRKLLDEGAIGEPVAFHSAMLSHGMEGWHPNPAFFYRPGAGPMFDMGPYYLAALVTLLGPVARVAGMSRISFPERTITSQPLAGTTFPVTTPTHIVSTLEFVTGVVGTLTTSFDVWATEQPKFEVYGADGSLSLAAPNALGGPVRVRGKGEEGWTEQPLVHRFNTLESGWGLALADLVLAIGQGRPHRADGRFALHVLEVMHACLSAAETGRTVAVESRCERPEPLWPGVDGGLLDHSS